MADQHTLPIDLRDAIAAAVSGVPERRLRAATTRLTERYRGRGQVPAPARRRAAPTEDDLHLAYLVTRMPATFAATAAVLDELGRRAPTLDVESLLDVGAGPGTGLWAAAGAFPGLREATLVEPATSMRAAGERLLAQAGGAARVTTRWLTATLSGYEAADRFDLVLAAYLLGELGDTARTPAVDALWRHATGALVIIEPGSRAGCARVLAARAWLIGQGAAILAPCPHAAECPLPDVDWCHFGARLGRSALHRRLKGARLAYEDEPYSYVIATPQAGAATTARVIRRPRTRPGQVLVELCTLAGLRHETVSRRQRERYRQARRLRWGDGWDEAPVPVRDPSRSRRR